MTRTPLVTEAELRQALVHIDNIIRLVPKLSKEIIDLKDIINESIISLQEERMRLFGEHRSD